MNISLKIEKSNVSIFLVWLVTISGIIGIVLGHLEWFISKTPFNLLLGILLLIWNFPPKNGWSSLLPWTLIFIFGIGAELIGVNTGLLFGKYSYGKNLGFKIYGVPPLIGINWVLLTFLTATISKRFFKTQWSSIFIGALLMVGLDFLIEPVAPHFDFWSWEQGFPPIRNFIDWFVLSVAFQIIVRKEIPEDEHALPIHHFLSQLVFFAFFYLFYAI
jgi:putative membrane protein